MKGEQYQLEISIDFKKKFRFSPDLQSKEAGLARAPRFESNSAGIPLSVKLSGLGKSPVFCSASSESVRCDISFIARS